MNSNKDIIKKINELKEQKNAVILAHYYTNPEIQDIADFLGDSLGLSRQAAKTKADIIVFCGVNFMAETASIISPNKKILIPDINSSCSLAESININQLKQWKKENSDAVVVTYVNTFADIKAESDYCCTSANAAKIVGSIDKDKKILFLPDKNLGKYAKLKTNRDIKIWQGGCHVHLEIDDKIIEKAILKHPEADILIHPECNISIDFIKNHKNIFLNSTAGMIKHAEQSSKKDFIIATEIGVIYSLQKRFPNKNFYAVSEKAVCEYMKYNNLEKIYNSLKKEEYEVKVENSLAQKASKSIEKMLKIS